MSAQDTSDYEGVIDVGNTWEGGMDEGTELVDTGSFFATVRRKAPAVLCGHQDEGSDEVCKTPAPCAQHSPAEGSQKQT